MESEVPYKQVVENPIITVNFKSKSIGYSL